MKRFLYFITRPFDGANAEISNFIKSYMKVWYKETHDNEINSKLLIVSLNKYYT